MSQPARDPVYDVLHQKVIGQRRELRRLNAVLRQHAPLLRQAWHERWEMQKRLWDTEQEWRKKFVAEIAEREKHRPPLWKRRAGWVVLGVAIGLFVRFVLP
jgi:hypothetical protein